MSNLDILGNVHADKLADTAALRFSVPLNVSAKYLYYIHLTKRIQFRLATILTSLPNRPKVDTAVHREPFSELTDTFNTSSHVLFEHDGVVSCARCHSSFNNRNPNLKRWLSSHCSKLGSDTDRPIPIPLEQVHRGKSYTHVSHHLYTFKGLVYCNRCGCRAGEAGLRKLGRPCEAPTAYGKASLTAFKAGKKPPSLAEWPCDTARLAASLPF